jgi:hypothetical protein
MSESRFPNSFPSGCELGGNGADSLKMFGQAAIPPVLDDFITLHQLLSQNRILFSQMLQFFFHRHALTLLALTSFGKSPADLGSYWKRP